MEQEIDFFAEVDEAEKVVRAVIDNSNFHYLSVRLALRNLVNQYDIMGEKYARHGIMKDISKYAKN